ncbi:2-polyprenyl-6-methoxyphenol hydroxylase-like FAD-dependent oxidoreductase [Amycolatopsis endophytica]|uniref:2-polyprenyl-6-methoxyphenol hydroxylase-like FAD-dependent oxidoreductase n=1 Tax=Amycolatopsis endophytica TaxID=860233 RepID=A0A853B577_9PSEU|nr:hypothetical protein [Amycolatopsis endophytica]NYI89937.1 2-polyprenyl-6-methoxyphenol hydroxylase-like FAD-dependent oxidoreductase [Amycolatopsis endophytica]
MARTFAGEGWFVPRLIEAMRDAPDFYLDRESKVSLPTWSRGRAVLLGDAAFAGSFGMGTSMAVVGAYVLAAELATAQGDHRRALEAYERRLRHYVQVNQKPMPGGTKSFLPKSRTAIRLGNAGMKVMLAGPWRKALTGGLEDKSALVALENPAVRPLRVDGGHG